MGWVNIFHSMFVALFYWTLLNIPAEFRAQLRFIHLFAVAYTKDVKRFGVEAILGRLVTEMNDLQKVCDRD